jgi:hypothetical protein
MTDGEADMAVRTVEDVLTGRRQLDTVDDATGGM